MAAAVFLYFVSVPWMIILSARLFHSHSTVLRVYCVPWVWTMGSGPEPVRGIIGEYYRWCWRLGGPRSKPVP